MFSYFIENLSLKRESKLDNFLNKKIVPSFFVKNIQFFRAISCGCPAYQSVVVKPSDPTDDDYKFESWYTEKECINEYDFSVKNTDLSSF